MADTTAQSPESPIRGSLRYARLDKHDVVDRRRTTHPDFARMAVRESHPLVDLEFGTLFSYLLERKTLVATALAVGILAGLGYGIVAPPRYTAEAEILIDPAGLRVVSDDLYASNDQRDALILNIESKMRVLTSGNVVDRVVADLNLTQDPEFVPSPPAWLPFTGAPSAPAVTARRSLLERLKAKRDEKSYVVTLSAGSDDPAKSVRIANAVIATFRDDLAKSEASGAARTADSLAEGLSALKQAAASADAAVEAFKRANNLQSSQGELASAQSMMQANTQLLDAQARLFEAKARYEKLTSGSEEGLMNAAAQESVTISALRAQYAATKQQADSMAATLGPLHPNMLAIRPQVESLQRQIADETARIVQAAKAAVEQNEAAVALLQSQANASRSTVAVDNSAQVQLRELEREAASHAAIYEAFLARTREVAEREQIDTTNIRVISEPAPPSKRTWPPSTIQLAALGGAAGLMLGGLGALGLGLWRDRKRTPAQQA